MKKYIKPTFVTYQMKGEVLTASPNQFGAEEKGTQWDWTV